MEWWKELLIGAVGLAACIAIGLYLLVYVLYLLVALGKAAAGGLEWLEEKLPGMD